MLVSLASVLPADSAVAVAAFDAALFVHVVATAVAVCPFGGKIAAAVAVSAAAEVLVAVYVAVVADN